MAKHHVQHGESDFVCFCFWPGGNILKRFIEVEVKVLFVGNEASRKCFIARKRKDMLKVGEKNGFQTGAFLIRARYVE